MWAACTPACTPVCTPACTPAWTGCGEKASVGQNVVVGDALVVGGAGPYSHVRVLCLDAQGRLLLMRWRDPVDGHDTWEPPGGKVEPGESLLEAAARELREETGIAAIPRAAYTILSRDDLWKGARRVRSEACFFAAIGDEVVRPEMPTEEERSTLVEWRLVRAGEIDRLDAPVYPGDPFGVLSDLIGS